MIKYTFLALALLAAAAIPVTPADAAPKKAYKSKPLKGVIYGNQRRIGGYSYKYSDVMEPSKFRNSPQATGLHDSGVIDGDFFYPRPSSPFGGYTPYMN